MQLHANAELSLKRRARMVREVVEQDRPISEAAARAGVSARTCRKWVGRFVSDGALGLLDRSSAPQRVANRTEERRIAVIAALRRLRMTGPEIAETLDMPVSTVSGILTRIGLGKLGRLGFEPAVRYERQRPGELVHIDVKKLGQIARPGHRMLGRQSAGGHHQVRYQHGWEFVHVAVDDCTRLAYVEVLPDEKANTAIAFLRRAVDFYARHGVSVERVITDNGSAYRSSLHRICCRVLGIRHLRTRPYRPQTNGKAERFIRTMLGGWAYGAIYRNSRERTAALDGWIDYYNHRRKHAALGRKPPIARLTERNNLLGTYN
jgi:transposase InsO family protein